MWKHIGFQALFQLVILLCLYLLAPKFIKEDNVTRLSENRIIGYCYGKLPGDITDLDLIIYGTASHWKSSDHLVVGKTENDCGDYASRQDMSVAFKAYTNANGSTTHMTLIFNVFVVYTLFNQINARVLDDSLNIFVRIHKNLFFPLITLLELALQIVIVCFGNAAFKVVESGLTAKQWGISIGFSAITFVLSFIIKFIPLERCIDGCLEKSRKKRIEEEKNQDVEVTHQSKENSNQKLVDKNNDVAIYVDKEGKKDEAQVQDTESKKVSRKVSRTRSLVRRASMRGEGSLRSRKASVLITNQE
jgi:magnesium-transporting ATPase (P-type)